VDRCIVVADQRAVRRSVARDIALRRCGQDVPEPRKRHRVRPRSVQNRPGRSRRRVSVGRRKRSKCLDHVCTRQ